MRECKRCSFRIICINIQFNVFPNVQMNASTNASDYEWMNVWTNECPTNRLTNAANPPRAAADAKHFNQQINQQGVCVCAHIFCLPMKYVTGN